MKKKIDEINDSAKLIRRRPIKIGLIYLFAIISSPYQAIQPRPGKTPRKTSIHEQVTENNIDNIYFLLRLCIITKLCIHITLRYEYRRKGKREFVQITTKITLGKPVQY